MGTHSFGSNQRLGAAADEGGDHSGVRGFQAGWIKEQQKKITGQDRESPREYIERESHYLWGKRYLLRIVERESPPQLQLRHNKMILQVRPGTGAERRQEILDVWHRTQLRVAVDPLIAKWEPMIRVRVERVFVQRMKTKWGSCSRRSASIRLNTDLAKKPSECGRVKFFV